MKWSWRASKSSVAGWWAVWAMKAFSAAASWLHAELGTYASCDWIRNPENLTDLTEPRCRRSEPTTGEEEHKDWVAGSWCSADWWCNSPIVCSVTVLLVSYTNQRQCAVHWTSFGPEFKLTVVCFHGLIKTLLENLLKSPFICTFRQRRLPRFPHLSCSFQCFGHLSLSRLAHPQEVDVMVVWFCAGSRAFPSLSFTARSWSQNSQHKAASCVALCVAHTADENTGLGGGVKLGTILRERYWICTLNTICMGWDQFLAMGAQNCKRRPWWPPRWSDVFPRFQSGSEGRLCIK